MPRTTLLVAVAIAIHLGVLVLPAQAQSIAEVAQREKERREAVESGSVFTNADLPRGRSAVTTGRLGAPPPLAPADDAAAPDPAGEAADAGPTAGRAVPVEASEKRDEAYWRARTADYDQRLTRLREDVTAMEGRLATIDAKVDAAETDGDRRLLQRQRAEVASALTRFRENLGFLEREYEGYRAFAAANDVEIR